MITEELKQKVKQVFKESNLNPNTIHQIIKKNPELTEQLQKEFNQKPNIYKTIGKLIKLIVNDIQLKHCRVCGKEMTYDRSISKAIYCSNKCKLSGEGNPFARKEVQEKIRQKCFKKYGVYNPGQSKELRQKRNKTCLQRYGKINPASTDEIKKKIRQSIKQHYGGNSQWDDINLRQLMIRSKYNTTYQKIVQRYKEQNIEPAFTKEEFIGTNHRYKWKCTKCGNIFQSIYHNGEITSRCFICHPRRSKLCMD